MHLTPAKPLPRRLTDTRARRLAALAPLVPLLLSAGCATQGAVPKGNVVWPLPPDKPRIRYLGSFNKPEHLPRSGVKAFFDALVPRDSRARIQSPTGLALSVDEKRLYVACSQAGRVVVVDFEGGSMDLAATAEQAKPLQPFGVALDAQDNLYVSDKAGSAILVYGPKGEFLRRFGGDLLQSPMSIALDRRRQLLYVVSGAATKASDHRVEVFSLAGQHLRTIGKRGGAPGEFNFPTHLALSAQGDLFVADMLNFRLQVFNPEGALQEVTGQIGAGEPGTFDKIKGIAFDSFGNLYVVDSLHGVQILNATRQPLLYFGGDGFMKVPNAIAIDSKNRIYVADYGQNGVHRFELFNTTADDSQGEPAPAAPAAPAPPRPN